MRDLPHASDHDLAACHACGTVVAMPPPSAADSDAGAHIQLAQCCPRCGVEVQLRKPQSLLRTWVMLITAAILYVPANTLPMLVGYEIGEPVLISTIMGGIVTLWRYGSPDLAVIVFIASIVVPITKLAVIAWLATATQLGLQSGLAVRTRLHHWMELIGYWSMLDVFVVALLTAVVQFPGTAYVLPGPAAAAFGAVVVLTMLASHSFDPRLAYDKARQRASKVGHATHGPVEKPARMSA